MDDSDSPQGLQMAIVRGDADPFDAEALGIEINGSPGSFVATVPAGLPVLTPSLADFATGFFAQWARGSRLQEWGFVVLGALDLDFDACESSPAGERLRELIWDAAAGVRQFSDDDIDFVRVLSEAATGGE